MDSVFNWEAFRHRENERAEVRSTIEPILMAIAEAETKLAKHSVFTSNERFDLGRARLALLRALRSIDKAGETLSEANMRAADAVSAAVERGR